MSHPNRANKLALRAAFLGEQDALQAWCRFTSKYTIDDLCSEIIPIIYSNLRNSLMNDRLSGILKGYYRFQWTKNYFLLNQLAEQLDVLGKSGIETIVLGNVPLAHSYYKDWGKRSIGNFEVVVKSDHFDDAESLLMQAGLPCYSPNELGSYLNLRASILQNIEKKIEEEFWRHRVHISILDTATSILNPIDQLLYSLTEDIGASKIMWLADVLTVVSSQAFDVKHLIKCAGRYGIASVLKEKVDFFNSQVKLELDFPSIARLRDLRLTLGCC